MGLWSNTTTFAGLSGNQPASKLDTNFSELAIMSAYATAVGGTANDIALTASLTLSSGLQAGVRIAFIAGSTNTGPMTASVNGSANPAIQKGTLSLASGDVKAGGFYELYHDGSVWQLQAPTQVQYLIQSQTVPNLTASVDFTSGITSSFNTYRFVFTDIAFSTANTNLVMRVSRTGGAPFLSGASDYQWSILRVNAGAVGSNGATEAQIQLAQTSSTAANNGLNGELTLFNPGGTTAIKMIKSTMVHLINGGSMNSEHAVGYCAMGTAGSPTLAVNAVTFFAQAGTLGSAAITGRITMYGLRSG